ncbi:sugar-binding domain-containing protein, partial [Eubacterium aggregans]
MFNEMVLIATLYYKEKMSQNEIAKKLWISSPWVSKLLTRAEESGIVKIEVLVHFTENTALEDSLMCKYNIEYVGVIKNESPMKDDLALAAANYFISELRHEDVVGVGWGTGVTRLISATESLCFPKVKILPLAGSFGNSLDFLPNLSSIRLAKTLGAVAEVIHAPAVCSSEEEFKTLMGNPQTKELLCATEHADILLLGMGTFESSTMPQYEIFTPEEIEEMRSQQVMGDIGLQYLDVQGKPIITSATKKLIRANIF